MDYSFFCYHQSTRRVDNNYVVCNNCGLSIVSHLQHPRNKNINDFTRENKQFNPNKVADNIVRFDKINNQLEYYTDKKFLNKILIDKSSTSVQYKSSNSNAVVKYKVTINDEPTYYDTDEIDAMLNKINAIRIDATQYSQIKN